MSSQVQGTGLNEFGPAIPPSAPRRSWFTGRGLGLRAFFRSRTGVAGLILLGLLILIALFAPLIAPHDPIRQGAPTFLGPSIEHPFGTDELGRDIFSRVIFGTSDALITAAGASALAAVVGVAIGVIAGYVRRWFDFISMRVMDVILGIPHLVLSLVILVILGPGKLNLLIAIAVGSVPAFARITRLSTMAEKDKVYVEAARGLGASGPDIVGRTILPNITAPIILQCVVTGALAVTTSASLSFLGFGDPPPAPTWGAMLQASQAYLYHSPWYGVFPGLALTITIASLDMIGRGIQSVDGRSSPRRAWRRRAVAS